QQRQIGAIRDPHLGVQVDVAGKLSALMFRNADRQPPHPPMALLHADSGIRHSIRKSTRPDRIKTVEQIRQFGRVLQRVGVIITYFVRHRAASSGLNEQRYYNRLEFRWSPLYSIASRQPPAKSWEQENYGGAPNRRFVRRTPPN